MKAEWLSMPVRTMCCNITKLCTKPSTYALRQMLTAAAADYAKTAVASFSLTFRWTMSSVRYELKFCI